MSISQIRGQKGEDKAAEFLEKEGYKIRHRNWKSPNRELDIVAENDEYIVFVEVKTRKAGYLMKPQSAVTKEKRNSIQYAAESYIRKFEIDKPARFDIVTVVAKGDSTEIEEHIPFAFYPTLR
jgi:putative endonuclease